MWTGRKLALTLAFTVLIALAAGVSCRGFFQGEILNTFTISPTTATVPLGGTFQMEAFGTNQDGTPAGNVTTKLTWSSDEAGSVGVGASSGTLSGVSISQTAATITASYENLSSQTATASVCVENGTDFLIAPSDGSITSGSPVNFTASTVASVNNTQTMVDITSAVQWSTSNSAVLSIASGADPAVGTTTAGSTGQVVVTASYTCNSVTNTFTTNFTVD
jgi:hypothetical protein